MKMLGAKIVHRLDGKNWHHSVSKDGTRRAIKAKLQDLLVYFIWKFLADKVIYQSEFVASVWVGERDLSDRECIIYNGVSLQEFAPKWSTPRKDLCCELVSVEGTVSGKPAVSILRATAPYSVHVYGAISREVKDAIEIEPISNVTFCGPIDRKEVPEVYSYGSIFLNLETNPACPNAVIEALASGVPVVGFDNGALRELVGEAGIVLPYGDGNPWKLEPPECGLLVEAIGTICEKYDEYSKKARSRAEDMFSMDKNAALYLNVLSGKNNESAETGFI